MRGSWGFSEVTGGRLPPGASERKKSSMTCKSAKDIFLSLMYGKSAMKPSGVITLTTDFGLSDPYVAMLKGVILSINSVARLVDISHHISAGSIGEAAYLIREAAPFFPKGTVHVAVVDPGVGTERRPIAIQTASHFFVGPDNGVFWPAVRQEAQAKVFHLTERAYFLSRITRTFHGREIFAPVAAHLSLGVDPARMGAVITDPVPSDLPEPFEKDDHLYGEIIRIDHFGNLITNIHAHALGQFLKSSDPFIRVGHFNLKRLRETYAHAGKGEPLALINSAGFLEIAVNRGRASEAVGVRDRDIVGTAVEVSRSF
jgi:S-adenosylmethionine hydrolase